MSDQTPEPSEDREAPDELAVPTEMIVAGPMPSPDRIKRVRSHKKEVEEEEIPPEEELLTVPREVVAATEPEPAPDELAVHAERVAAGPMPSPDRIKPVRSHKKEVEEEEIPTEESLTNNDQTSVI